MNLKQKLNTFFSLHENIAQSFMYEDSCEFSSFLEDNPEDYAKFSDVKVEMLDHYGGEDQGSEYYSIWKFTKDSEVVIIRFEGYYQSHYGTDYLGFRFVEPKQKTITVYE